jgi:hypothetical protein
MIESRGEGSGSLVGSRSLFLSRDDRQRVGRFSAVETQSTIAGRVSRLWSRLSRERRSGPELHWEQRLEALEARVDHLESAHEGLQDAVYRRAVLEDASIEDLRRRSEPGQIARELSEDARRRGL